MELIFHDHDDSKQIVSRDISFRPSDTVETVVTVVKENFIAGLKLDFELVLEKEGNSLESAKTLAEALWGEKGLESGPTEATPVFVRWKEEAKPGKPGQSNLYLKIDAKWAEEMAEKIDFVELHDGIENLSWQKLDRIHRFIRLSRKAEMSFEQLDWLVGSRQNYSVGKRFAGRGDPTTTTTYAPFFDGMNDIISVNLEKIIPPRTVEFWIKPMKSGESQGIMSFGLIWSLFLDQDGKLVLWFNKKVFGLGDSPLPLRKFTHVALVFFASKTGKESVTAFANGNQLYTTIDEEADVVQPNSFLIDEKVLLIGQHFKG
jgi:hypothetical protein